MEDVLTTKLAEVQSKQELDQVVSLFNSNMLKRQMIRTNRYADLQDRLISQLEERIEKRPGNFSDETLLKMVTSIEGIIDKKQQLDVAQTPQIQLQQNIVVSDIDMLTKDSRDRIREAVKSVISQLDEQQEAEVVAEQEFTPVEDDVDSSKIADVIQSILNSQEKDNG